MSLAKRLTGVTVAEAESALARAFHHDTHIFPITVKIYMTGRLGDSYVGLIISSRTSGLFGGLDQTTRVLQVRLLKRLKALGLHTGAKTSKSMGGNPLYAVNDESALDSVASVLGASVTSSEMSDKKDITFTFDDFASLEAWAATL